MKAKPRRSAPGSDMKIVLARVEERLDGLCKQIEANQRTAGEDRDSLRRDIRVIQDELVRYKGMWGGLVLAAGAIALAGKLLFAWFLRGK